MKKKIGLGSLALLISILFIFLSITFNRSGVCYGDKLVNLFGLKAWSNGTSGTHYTLLYLLPFFILSIFLGYKFCDNFGAKIGRRISIFFVTIIVISFPFMSFSIKGYENNVNIQQSKAGTADYLFNLKTSYIGDNSAVGRLLEALDLGMYGKYTFELQTTKEPYILTINYNTVEGWGPIEAELITEKSAILLALIENANEIHWIVPDINEPYKITTSDLLTKYGDIKEYNKSVENLKLLLIKLGYYEEDEPITISIKKLTNAGLTLLITNHTNNDYLYGESYSLERKENDKWVEVKQIVDNCVFISIGYTLKDNQTAEKKANWEYCYGKLPNGQYRITKDFDHILSDSESEFNFGKKHIISVEFTI